MKLIFLLIISVFFVSLSVASQESHIKDSIEKVITKVSKGKELMYTELIDDSTGRTYEFSERSGALTRSCLKTNHHGITRELHFYYNDGFLLRVSLAEWNRNTMKAAFETYYFRQGQLFTGLAADNVERDLINKMPSMAKALYERGLSFKTEAK